MHARLVLVTALMVCAFAPVARADGPMRFRTARMPGIDGSGTEPRMTIGPDDVRWAMTNVSRAGGSGAVVFRSVDEGQTWQRTKADPPQTGEATIDVDIVAMHTGRIYASELDEAGLNFPGGVTDDGGATWKESRGGTMLADQDRQWFAVGPDDKTTRKPRVYLLYHNLGSGIAQHNMFVATSTDGGETFGPPVPIAQPGQDAYQDLQCADSGGPSSISVNQQTGRIYATYTTRAGRVAGGGPDVGGCAAQPIEFNIVNGTRVWVATSADGSPGSWTNSLAVDDSQTNQVVSMQLAYGALDNRGGVYVAYPESPKPYPDLTGAAVKVRWQQPRADGTLADDAWSKPVTLAPASSSGGNTLVHLAVGDPGKIAVAYYHGVDAPGGEPIWTTHVLHSLNLQAPQPEIVDQQVSAIPTYRWTASKMMGICGTTPAQGIENGVRCARSTDVWGIALDRQCRLSLVWPTDAKDKTTKGLPGDAPGTYVSTQTDGPDLCGADDLPGGSAAAAFTAGATGTACADGVPPTSRVRGRIRAGRRGVRFAGTSRDTGCGSSGAPQTVRVAIGRRLEHRRCRYLRGDGRLAHAVPCTKTTYLSAKGRARWSYRLRHRLPRGRYVVWVRGIDRSGNIERKARRRNLARFTVR